MITGRNLLTSRELDSRVSDGVRVTLLWDPVDGGLAVTVVDGNRHRAFVIDVPADARPLDVFQHPDAYAVTSRS